IMIIATDVTEIKKLEKRNKDESELHRTLLKILKSKNELVELLDLLKEMPTIAQDPKTAMRNLHTLKGEFGYLECNKFSQLCHKLEDRLSSKYTPDEFLKGVQDLQAQVNQFLTDHDSILNMKGERHRIVPIEAKALADLVEEAKQLKAPDRIIRSLEAMTEVPIEECLGWMSDVFCQVGKEAGKEVKPISWKSSERICPDLYKGLFKSLIHISRNAAVHGIETPEEREAIGKPHEGSLRCEFKKQKNGDYYLRFQDDGKGIDVEAVKAKAKALGVPEPKEMKEVVNLLLSGKVSTSQKVTEISGRGIGLNAVQREVEKLGGTMEMSHEPGKGTNIEITFGNLEKKFENRSRLTA
ncbi:MAG: ATP-binding protein, partial [Bdellovibrionia bacterium]